MFRSILRLLIFYPARIINTTIDPIVYIPIPTLHLLRQLAKRFSVAVLLQIGTEVCILSLHILVHGGDQEPRNETTRSSKGCANKENALHAFFLITERVLDRGKDLCADGSSSLANSSSEAEEMAAKWCRERLGTAEERGDLCRLVCKCIWSFFLLNFGKHCTYTRAHLAESIKDTVKDDKQGEDGLDGAESTTDDESQNGPQHKTQSHCLLTANAVHEEATSEAAGKIKQIDHGAISNVLRDGVVGVEGRHDG